MGEIKVGDKYISQVTGSRVTITDVGGDTVTFTFDTQKHQTPTSRVLHSFQALYHKDHTVVKDSDKLYIVSDGSPSSSYIKPPHYNSTSITALQVIDSWSLDFRLGNAVKYISRFDKKGTAVQDLEKAVEYIQLKIKQLKEAAK